MASQSEPSSATKRGFAVFLTIALTLWALIHFYVGWNLALLGVPLKWLWPAGFILWLSYPVARWRGWPWLESIAANWLGILFLQFAALLVADMIAWYWPVALLVAVIIAGVLAIIALVQGHRPPVLTEHEVMLPGLPRELQLIALSDLHLGTLIGERWAARLIARINALHPDLVCIVGDLVDGNVEHVEKLLPVLRQLRAPLGVYAVTGNHEYYAGADSSVRLLEQAGYTVLRDRVVEVTPGLILAGVDDLTARTTALPALANSTILLSHTPAIIPGAKLILSGHTHGGQIWPFTYLVRLRHKLIGGRYALAGTTVIVSRGAGTWGPRMRLWRPSEFLRIRLRSAAS